jgi:hypothetical protein
MAKNSIHFNEFDLEINNGIYQLKCVKPFKKRLTVYDEESIWKFLKNKYSLNQFMVEPVFIFFITEDNKVKGFSQMDLIIFENPKWEIYTIGIIFMANVKKIIFVMLENNSSKKELTEILNYPSSLAKYFKKKLDCSRVEVVDTLVVSNEICHSLKENSLI